MKNQYQTAQVARMIGIHPNTVRLYEELGFITQPERLANGYRVFTDLHIAQFQLARKAFQVEILQNGLRKKMIYIIKLSAQQAFDEAISCTIAYMQQVEIEEKNAEEAIEIAKAIVSSNIAVVDTGYLTRKQAAQYLQVSIDTLRNWELNGLFAIKRMQNGYRIYTREDLKRLKIIRTLRCANYSLSAILRMINALENDKAVDVRTLINTPDCEEEIITACDKLLSSLQNAYANAGWMLNELQMMKEKFNNNPPL